MKNGEWFLKGFVEPWHAMASQDKYKFEPQVNKGLPPLFMARINDKWCEM